MTASTNQRTHIPQKNLTGKRFGKLTVQQESVGVRSNARHMDCLCDCGNTKTVRLNNLLNGNTKSCGCLRPGFKRTTHVKKGEKYGRLTVVQEREPCGSPARRAVDVVCDCGTELWVFFNPLKAGNVKSCGCLRDEYYDSLRVYSADPSTPKEDSDESASS